MKKLLIFAGLSAVGKTTLANYITERNSDFVLVRSATTRAPRGDGNDSEYLYLTKEKFNDLVKTGDMLEYTEYAGNFYGTPRSEIERIIGEGRAPLLILDLNGVHTVANSKSDISPCAVYLTAKEEELEARLRRRYGTDIEKLNSRLEKNISERAYFEEIKNDFFAVVESSGNVGKCAEKIALKFDCFCKK